MSKKTWIVIRRDHTGLIFPVCNPSKEHDTKQSAVHEAERLAARTPYVRFVVFEAISNSQHALVNTTELI